jgi:hypothetical protein
LAAVGDLPDLLVREICPIFYLRFHINETEARFAKQKRRVAFRVRDDLDLGGG